MIALSAYTDFGPAGVAVISATLLLAKCRPVRGQWPVGPVGVLANARPGPPVFVPTDLFALLATPVMLLSPRLSRQSPRLPKHFFYACDPAHLYVLHLIDLYR